MQNGTLRELRKRRSEVASKAKAVAFIGVMLPLFLLSGCLRSEGKRWARAELSRVENAWPIMRATNPSIEEVDRWYLTSYYTYWRFVNRVLSGEVELRPRNTSMTYGYCNEKNFHVLYFTWITEQPNHGIGIFLEEELGLPIYIPLTAQAQIYNSRDAKWGMEGYSIDLTQYFPLKTLERWVEERSLPRMKVLLNNGGSLENEDYFRFFRDAMDPQLGMGVDFIDDAELPNQALVEEELKTRREDSKKVYDFAVWWNSPATPSHVEKENAVE